jgi:hypothetical protein
VAAAGFEPATKKKVNRYVAQVLGVIEKERNKSRVASSWGYATGNSNLKRWYYYWGHVNVAPH